MTYTYILKCADETYYIGWTTDLQKRVETHNEGKGAKYTRGRRPVELVYYEEYPSRSDAQKREVVLKGLNRREKEKLIHDSKKLDNL